MSRTATNPWKTTYPTTINSMKSKATATTTTMTRKPFVAVEILASRRLPLFFQTDLEKQSKKIREKQRQAKERSEQELLTNIQQQEKVQ